MKKAQGRKKSIKPPPETDPEAAESEAREEPEEGAALNSLQQYLREISVIRLLSADEEKRLSRLLQKGDLEAKKKLISANLRLVVYVAKKFSNRGLALLDLIEEGNLGLIRAAEKFKASKGFRFSTYATWWIRQSIQRGLVNQAGAVRLPIHVAEAVQKAMRVREELALKLGADPTPEQLADSMKVSVKKAKSLMEASQRFISLDAVAGGQPEGTRFSDLLEDTSAPSPDSSTLKALQSGEVKGLLSHLSAKQQEVLTARFGLNGGNPQTLEDVGKALNLTRERIRQIEMSALRRLRTFLK